MLGSKLRRAKPEATELEAESLQTDPASQIGRSRLKRSFGILARST